VSTIWSGVETEEFGVPNPDVLIFCIFFGGSLKKGEILD